ncbi:co-chaperone YbbN [Candidatus Binatia bacterium]|nr:co-chaperone YbbN [Candidatus Binatia bacterium]
MDQSTPSAWVKDVTDRDFQREVIEKSRTVPVVVDLWAPWCGPCKQLGPLLERLAAEGGGKWILAKVNVDESPQVARALGVQSIPLVLAFKDADIISEFVGAQPENVVRQFIERLVPDEARRLVGEALQLAQRGDAAGAEAKLREVLTLFPENAPAAVALAKILAASGRDDDAMKVLDDSTATGSAAAEIEQAKAALRLRGGVNGDETALRARIAADPKDHQARIDLGRLLSASGQFEEALALLLESVRLDRGFDEGAARKAMLDVFALLGRENPLVDKYQRELSRLLFS